MRRHSKTEQDGALMSIKLVSVSGEPFTVDTCQRFGEYFLASTCGEPWLLCGPADAIHYAVPLGGEGVVGALVTAAKEAIDNASEC